MGSETPKEAILHNDFSVRVLGLNASIFPRCWVNYLTSFSLRFYLCKIQFSTLIMKLGKITRNVLNIISNFKCSIMLVAIIITVVVELSNKQLQFIE